MSTVGALLEPTTWRGAKRGQSLDTEQHLLAGPRTEQEVGDDARHGGTKASKREALYGALVRALVVLFARPVRLFRPVKVTSLQLLESLAKREGRTLNIRYLWRVLRREKWSFLPHLLGPPLAYQTVVGFSLFSVYTVTERQLTRRREQSRAVAQREDQAVQVGTPAHVIFTPLDIVIYSGAAAGVAQCILSAPLDNVRFILENGIGRSGGSAANVGTHRRRTVRTRVKGASPANVRFGIGASVPTSAQLQVSWRAVAKAALLPFMPSTAHSRLTEQVKQQGERLAAAASGKVGETVDATGHNISAAKKELWQQTLKAWRGGLHGSGLIMSLCRDSVGFAAFFAVFELSRRCAYHSSMAIDQFEAWISTTIPLLRFGPISKTEDPIPAHQHAPFRRFPSSSDVVYIESKSSSSEARNYFGDSEIRPDISYNSTRTVSGRIVAVLVLVVGGAIGATLYELVGRPFELMRLVIFTGTREWERQTEWRGAASAARARNRTAKQAADGADARGRQGATTLPYAISTTGASTKRAEPSLTATIRAASPDRAQHGRTTVRGARLRSFEHALEIRRPHSGHSGVGLFLTLRSANTMGDTTSRVGSSALQGTRRAAHPLAISPSKTQERRQRQKKVELSRQRVEAKLTAAARANSLKRSDLNGSSHPATTRSQSQHSQLNSELSARLPPRPSTISLLVRHAKHTDPAFLRDMLARYPKPLALLALCGKSYFVGPFLANVGGPDTYLGALKSDERVGRMREAVRAKLSDPTTHTSSSAGSSGPSLAQADSPSSVIRTIRYRGTHAWDGALRWTNVAWRSRWGWAFRRMATPYGLGFLAFAWFGGDLNR
ncbi:hypothetical protein CF319_g7466 [Tilletia indica]|nr:hypothetical protein CF319_g7466 [Tilletia indica]